jgi:hypothetical protein
MIFYSSRIQDQKGTGSRIRIRNTDFFTKICGAGEIPEHVYLLTNPRLPHPRLRPGAPCHAGLGRVPGHERPEVLLQPPHPREELETPAQQVQASLNVIICKGLKLFTTVDRLKCWKINILRL